MKNGSASGEEFYGILGEASGLRPKGRGAQPVAKNECYPNPRFLKYGASRNLRLSLGKTEKVKTGNRKRNGK